MTIHEMQNLNRATIEHASKVIVPGMTLIELRKLCEEYMLSHGADSFWYSVNLSQGIFTTHGAIRSPLPMQAAKP